MLYFKIYTMKKPIIIILSAGIGKSFVPIATNKTLFKFLGKPVLQHTIEMAESAGFDRALIITNPENESWLRHYQPFNITIHTKIATANGMGDCLLQAYNEIADNPCIVLNACDFFEPNFLRDFYNFAKNTKFCITGYEVSSYFPAGYLKITQERAVDIVEKPKEGEEPSNLINLVAHYFSKPQQFLNLIQKEELCDIQYENALKKLFQQESVAVYRYKGLWSKLKYSFHILDVMNTLLSTRVKNHVSRSAVVSSKCSISGKVFIDDGAVIDDFAVIKGPSYIGKNVHIGSNVLIRQSSIENNSTVGFGSEVARSYVGPSCMLHHNFVGDSVLEENVNPSWGTTFANLRSDKKTVMLKLPNKKLDTKKTKLGAIVAKNVFMGVNCSVMPGVTIAENVKIKPGSVVFEG